MRLFILALSLFLTSISLSQEPIYKHFGVDEGLASSEVYDVYQDKQGYIWFATDKGLSRYNGYEFENFDTTDGLPGNVVLRFYPQTNGDVWCYTYHNKALFYFNENFNGFTTYKYNKLLNDELNPYSTVKSVFVDELNTVHLGGWRINGMLLITNTGKIDRKHANKSYFNLEDLTEHYLILNNYSNETNSYYTTSNKQLAKKGFPNKRELKINSTHIDVSWLIPNKKIILMNGKNIDIISSDNNVKSITSNYTALGVKAIDSKTFFVGYLYDGAKILNDKGEIIKTYLKEKSVTKFLIDHEGGYWFTTSNSGVYYIKNPSIYTYQHSEEATSLHINSLVKKNEDLLIGYKNGDFASISNKGFEFKKTLADGASTIVEYDSIFGKTYITRNHQNEVNGKLIFNGYVTKLSEPELNENVFASTVSGYIDLKSNKKFMLPFRVQDVCIWKTDTLIATPKGVFKKNNHSIVDLFKRSNLLGYRCDDMDVSPNGKKVYMATQGAGIVVYGDTIYNITTQDGLTSNIINEVHIENKSTIWACTNRGLNRVVFSDKGFKISTLDKNSGLLSNEVEDVEIINDTLWVGTKEGLSYMPKKVLNNKIKDSIYLTIKEVDVNNKIYDCNKVPKLKYNQNKITFLVEAIAFAKHEDLNYQYRLKEIDNKWSATKNRRISYPNLKFGNYTFEVKACITNNCSENISTYRFIIQPPFWKSWWFYTLCLVAFGGLVYVFFKIRLLTYNKDVIRELIRLLIKRLKKNETFLKIRTNGEDLKIPTSEIIYIKSSGNYLDVFTTTKTYTIRCKIGDFIATTPDTLEYLRVHRSYIIRIDKVTSKSKNTVAIKNQIIPVGETYLSQLDKIQF